MPFDLERSGLRAQPIEPVAGYLSLESLLVLEWNLILEQQIVLLSL